MYLAFTARSLEYSLGIALGFLFVQRNRALDDHMAFKFLGTLTIVILAVIFITLDINNCNNYMYYWFGNGLLAPVFMLIIYCYAIEKDFLAPIIKYVDFLGNGSLAAYIFSQPIKYYFDYYDWNVEY